MNVEYELYEYRYCFVPLCSNTSVSTPEKKFINVPRDAKRRELWIKAVRRDESSHKLSLTTALYCCQDHFNLEEDMENFLRVKLMGGQLHTKKNVVPHIFDCQLNRQTSSSVVPLRGTLKLYDAHHDIPPTDEQELNPVAHYSDQSEEVELTEATVSSKNVETQTIVGHRSRYIQCYPKHLGLYSSVKTSPIKTSPVKMCDAQVSPISLKPRLKRARLTVDSVFTDSSEEDTSEPSKLTESNTDTTLAEGDKSIEIQKVKATSIHNTKFYCKEHSMRYLGVPKDSFVIIIDMLANKIVHNSDWLTSDDIVFLVLRKIRLNESFAILGDNFGISVSQATKLFSEFLHIVANCLSQFIVWPKKETVNCLLPGAFMARYSNVQSIIDCFEIEIEKPSRSLHQSLTWSEYKKANTLKYLVSSTPDGIINFVSKGYGGRITDMLLLEMSGYLDKLSPGNMEVMADRGFKHVEDQIRERGCTLVRPPSVVEGVKPDAAAVKETKRIASLRIHIERTIRRFREFKSLTPHACIDIQ